MSQPLNHCFKTIRDAVQPNFFTIYPLASAPFRIYSPEFARQLDDREARRMEGLDQKVTVCDKCLRASCWQGIFMCDESQTAGTIQKTRRELLKLGKEHTDYIKTDEELRA